MADLRVSYATLDGVRDALDAAQELFANASVPTDGGAFGADEVTDAFTVFRASQERSAGWLADASRTLAQYAHDTKSLVQDADAELAGKVGGKG
ncbi:MULTISPECIES: hypothetical protein [unclassified Curtobacterium]|uniref:hypothetical protein n=1 Tax=unclassified Curtobacterium TaxID=257496 RepID=UPI0008DD6102|nr:MULTISPECIES: hypothetical protein [unclassified Curtobacterium]OII16905.1 hypothetical protein BIV03_04655 [Curtobacterium sp. MCBA15_016]SFF91612.1 hypothetical protein SAMN05216329_3270 [Curtobacterium sp. YR515]